MYDYCCRRRIVGKKRLCLLVSCDYRSRRRIVGKAPFPLPPFLPRPPLPLPAMLLNWLLFGCLFFLIRVCLREPCGKKGWVAKKLAIKVERSEEGTKET